VRKINGLSFLGAGLLLLSAIFYSLHFFFYHDRRFVLDSFLGNFAFLPISILFVTIIFQAVLDRREKDTLLNKLNMVIGAFFSETGNEILRFLGKNITINSEIREALLVKKEWNKKEFLESAKKARDFNYMIDSRKAGLLDLKKMLAAKREFMLRLLENQNLLEHETFTDLLWAVFHLTEELESRKKVTGLSPADYAHISGDIKRAYNLLVYEWMMYMCHLKEYYPYLFSLAVRTNPFDPSAKVEVSRHS
jgi:hypothetical protein